MLLRRGVKTIPVMKPGFCNGGNTPLVANINAAIEPVVAYGDTVIIDGKAKGH